MKTPGDALQELFYLLYSSPVYCESDALDYAATEVGVTVLKEIPAWDYLRATFGMFEPVEFSAFVTPLYPNLDGCLAAVVEITLRARHKARRCLHLLFPPTPFGTVLSRVSMAVGVCVLLGGLLGLAGRASASQVGVETPCDEMFSVPVPNGQVLADNSLLDTDGTIYPPDLYWDFSPNGTADWRGCICLLRPCVRKCCREKMLNDSGSCVISDHPSLYPFSPNVYNKDTERVNVSEDHFIVLYGDPCGDKGKFLLEPEVYPDDRYFLLEDGSLLLPNLDNNTLDSSQFCIELINGTRNIMPFMCFPEADTVLASNEDAVTLMYPIGMLLSEPFLLVTVLVYALIPELRNLHGKSLMCHVSSLLTAYLFLSMMQLNVQDIGNISCMVSGERHR
uniref:Methuselah N-terminal domain-containing protein n=1 Tax=Timema bartmani TaxID=61472 RepID=A0A7R9EZR2_9NEOP|nr:unnamed protein product [Timema bartmani]